MRSSPLGLLDLPAELRNQIYELVLAMPGKAKHLRIGSERVYDLPVSSTVVYWMHNQRNPSTDTWERAPVFCRSVALLRTNSQIYEEASTILYHNFGFLLWCGDSPDDVSEIYFPEEFPLKRLTKFSLIVDLHRYLRQRNRREQVSVDFQCRAFSKMMALKRLNVFVVDYSREPYFLSLFADPENTGWAIVQVLRHLFQKLTTTLQSGVEIHFPQGVSFERIPPTASEDFPPQVYNCVAAETLRNIQSDFWSLESA